MFVGLVIKLENFQKNIGAQIRFYSFVLKLTNMNVKLKITHSSYVAGVLHMKVLLSKS